MSTTPTEFESTWSEGETPGASPIPVRERADADKGQRDEFAQAFAEELASEPEEGAAE